MRKALLVGVWMASVPAEFPRSCVRVCWQPAMGAVSRVRGSCLKGTQVPIDPALALMSWIVDARLSPLSTGHLVKMHGAGPQYGSRVKVPFQEAV